jgi:hypothetical protein
MILVAHSLVRSRAGWAVADSFGDANVLVRAGIRTRVTRRLGGSEL